MTKNLLTTAKIPDIITMVLCYDVPASAHKSNVYVFPIVNEETTVNYLEAYIKAPK